MNKKIPDLIRDHIKKEHTNGVGVTELARTFGVSRSTIYNLIRSAPREAKETVPISEEGVLIAHLAGVSPAVASTAYCKCIELDKSELREITPTKVLNAGINIGRSVDTNTILHPLEYALVGYPVPALMALGTGLTYPLSWVDVYVMLRNPRAWVQHMVDSGKSFSDWGLFKEDSQ